MAFQTHRPTQTLLIPQKRPLLAPVKPTINVVQHQHQHQHQTSPENNPPNTTTTTTTTTTITPQKEERKEEPQPAEYDFARIPQPFLDPRLWENIKSVDSLYPSSSSSSFPTAAFSGAEATSSSIRERRGMNEKEAEEEDRRKRAREAEYGGMAVRGRSGVRGRRDR